MWLVQLGRVRIIIIILIISESFVSDFYGRNTTHTGLVTVEDRLSGEIGVLFRMISSFIIVIHVGITNKHLVGFTVGGGLSLSYDS